MSPSSPSRPSTNAPIVVSSLFVVAQLLWSIQLALRPDPFAAGSATLIVAGITVYTVIAVVGILLVRALWARWLALATTIATLTLGSLGRFEDVLPYAAAAVSLLAVVAGISTGWWGAAVFIAYGSAVVALSWSSEARDAMAPVLAPLPSPRVAPHTGGMS